MRDRRSGFAVQTVQASIGVEHAPRRTGSRGLEVKTEERLHGTEGRGIGYHWPGIVASAVSLVIYVRTTCPTVWAYDAAELAIAARTLGLPHSPGYPLYTLLGHLFTFLPVGSVAYRVNLMSAVCAGLSVGALYACLYQVARSRIAAVGGALAFAFSAVYWEQAVQARVYPLQFFLVGTALACLLAWWRGGARRLLFVAAVLAGFSLTNHVDALLLFPGVVYLVWQGTRRAPLPARDWVLLALTALAPLLLYAYLPLRAGMHPVYDWPREVGLNIRTWRGLLAHVSGSSFDISLSNSSGDVASGLSFSARLLLQSFAWIGVPFGLAGLVWLYRRERVLFWCSVTLFVPVTALFVNYQVYNQEVFLLPSLFLWTWWMAAGMHFLIVAMGQEFPSLRTVACAAGLVALAPALFSLAGNFRGEDYRLRTGFAEDCRASLLALPPHTWLFSRWAVAKPLRYFQLVDGLRPDVTVYDSSHADLRLQHGPQGSRLSLRELEKRAGVEYRRAASREVGRRPTYSTLVDPDLALSFDFLRHGSVYEMKVKHSPRVVTRLPEKSARLVTFDHDFLLAAASVSPTRLQAGYAVRLTLVSAVLHPTGKHYRVALLLAHPGEELTLERVYEPGSLELPTSHWKPGVLLTQHYDVGIPAALLAGDYVVSLGVLADGKPVAPTEPASRSPVIPVARIRLVR